jgi:lycopene cyclase domain-containing protein
LPGCPDGRKRSGGESLIAGHLEYLLLLALCVIITLPLEFILGARVYRRPRHLMITLLPVVLIFSVWDVIGVLRDHWRYDPAQTTGLMIFGVLPIEELAFFVVIPICGLLTYSAVGRLLAARRSGAGQDDDA